MKGLTLLILIVNAAVFFQIAKAQDYCYRAQFVTDAAVNDDVAGRRTEIEDAVNNMLNELGNDTSIGFTTNSRNVTLEQISGNTTRSIYVVSICLTNSSLDESQLTQNLETFNFTTQIDNMAVTAGDFDECTGNFTTNCANFAICNNNNGSFACTCQDEYADKSTNNATGEICELPTNFTCSSNTVNVTAYNPYFDNLGINYTELRLGDCSGTLSGNDILYNGECNPAINANDTHLIYMWNLTNVNDSASITVGNYVSIPITCTFLSSSNVSVNISAERRDILFGNSLNNLPGQAYDFTAEAFSNSDVTTRLTGAVRTNIRMFFRLGTGNTIPSNVRIQCQGFSTEAADGSSTSIQLINNGCTAPITNANRRLLETVSIVRNGVGSTAVVGVNSHFYGSSTVTLARFQVNACVATGGSNCEYQCTNARRRRNVIQYRVARETVGTAEVDFAFQRAPEDGCNRNCGEGGLCVYDQISYEQRCVCADGYSLEREVCKEDVNISSEDEVNNQFVIYILIGVISFLAILVLLLVILFVLRRRKKNGRNYDVTYANTYATEQKIQ